MGKQRRSWSVEEKLATVLAVLSGCQSVAEAARQRGVNENPVYRWKERFLEAGRQGLRAYPKINSLIYLYKNGIIYPQREDLN